jgi:uncharacterized protein
VFRFIRGADCYWAVGQRRVSRVPLSGVTADGQPTDRALQQIKNARLSPAVDPGLYHMTVVVTTTCNLACSYCFQNTSPADQAHRRPPGRIPAAVVADDSVPAILAFGRRQMAQRGAGRLDLMLFGGEPTLYLDRCLRLLDGARELGLERASMISNATRLGAAAAAALERAGLQSVQVTLDGDAPVHDKLRITPGGRGTFWQILGNVEQAASSTSMQFMLRVNLTAQSIGTAEALVERLAARLDPGRFGISFALVNDSGVGFTETITPSPAVAVRVSELYRQAMSAGFKVSIPRTHQCIACDAVGGGTGAVINADGTLYSCWESAGKEGYEVGTISEGYAADEVVRSRWVSCGFEARSRSDAQDFDDFNDRVSAAILDSLYAAGHMENSRIPAAR